jgi:hypothetical protein
MDSIESRLAVGGRILRPGVRSLPPGFERYRIVGGGSLIVALAPGDKLRLVDPEGLQPCELVAFHLDGRAEPGILRGDEGPVYLGSASKTKAMVTADTPL